MKKLYILILFAAGFIACDPDDPEFISVDKSQIDNIHNEISGPTTVVAGTRPSFQAMPRSGSSFTWTLQGTGVNGTITESEDYEFLADLVIEQFRDDERTATLTVTEQTDWGHQQEFTYDLVVKPFSNNITGPGNFVSGTSGKYSVTNHPGSSYKWSISGADNATLTSSTGNEVIITSKKSEVTNTVTVTVTETPANGSSLTVTKDVVIDAFCDYNADTWSGAFTALEKYPGEDYGPYAVLFTQDSENSNKFIFDNFWDSGITAYVVFDPGSFEVTFPEQDDGNGNIISGTGIYDQCAERYVITTSYKGYTFDYVFTKI